MDTEIGAQSDDTPREILQSVEEWNRSSDHPLSDDAARLIVLLFTAIESDPHPAWRRSRDIYERTAREQLNAREAQAILITKFQAHMLDMERFIQRETAATPGVRFELITVYHVLHWLSAGHLDSICPIDK